MEKEDLNYQKISTQLEKVFQTLLQKYSTTVSWQFMNLFKDKLLPKEKFYKRFKNKVMS